MARLLLMILACIVAIWAAMASVTPGRHRAAPDPEPAAPRIEAEPLAIRPAEDTGSPSASELAPDAGADTGAPLRPAQTMPGPALQPSPQYPDTIAPGAEAAPEAAAAPAGRRRVTAARVNLRGGPGTDHAVIGAVTQGMLVTPLAPEADGWQHVRGEDGTEGYMSAQFLSAPLP